MLGMLGRGEHDLADVAGSSLLRAQAAHQGVLHVTWFVS